MKKQYRGLQLFLSAAIIVAGLPGYAQQEFANTTGSFILTIDGDIKLELNIDVTAKTLNTVMLSSFMVEFNS